MGKARGGLLRNRSDLMRGTVWKASLRLRARYIYGITKIPGCCDEETYFNLSRSCSHTVLSHARHGCFLVSALGMHCTGVSTCTCTYIQCSTEQHMHRRSELVGLSQRLRDPPHPGHLAPVAPGLELFGPCLHPISAYLIGSLLSTLCTTATNLWRFPSQYTIGQLSSAGAPVDGLPIRRRV